jgi:general transcription factor 3C polypeptide 5 (transcription factor C subunit 1)
MHTNNVLLKITVPKRTGRKRKRGSSGFMHDESFDAYIGQDEMANGTILQSHSRRDHPKVILRSLRDNVGRYQVEAVGIIEQTHRYRGRLILLARHDLMTDIIRVV